MRRRLASIRRSLSPLALFSEVIAFDVRPNEVFRRVPTARPVNAPRARKRALTPRPPPSVGPLTTKTAVRSRTHTTRETDLAAAQNSSPPRAAGALLNLTDTGKIRIGGDYDQKEEEDEHSFCSRRCLPFFSLVGSKRPSPSPHRGGLRSRTRRQARSAHRLVTVERSRPTGGKSR
jgi:hypothetical protein